MPGPCFVEMRLLPLFRCRVGQKKPQEAQVDLHRISRPGDQPSTTEEETRRKSSEGCENVFLRLLREELVAQYFPRAQRRLQRLDNCRPTEPGGPASCITAKLGGLVQLAFCQSWSPLASHGKYWSIPLHHPQSHATGLSHAHVFPCVTSVWGVAWLDLQANRRGVQQSSKSLLVPLLSQLRRQVFWDSLSCFKRLPHRYIDVLGMESALGQTCVPRDERVLKIDHFAKCNFCAMLPTGSDFVCCF